MNFPLPSTVIALLLGEYGPLAKIARNWPLVEAALDAAAIYSLLCAVFAIATISVETGRFSPIKERGGPMYFADLCSDAVLSNVIGYFIDANPNDPAGFSQPAQKHMKSSLLPSDHLIGSIRTT